MSAGMPRAVFGLPAYNHAHQLKEALESLLLQTCRDFRIIVSDDQSTDETPDLVQQYARADERIVYRRTDRRLGYIGNARRCFELARELFPEAEFFAWASDHDVWHPLWLERLIAALDSCPEAVLAYPDAFRLEGDGSVSGTKCFALCTVGEPNPRARLAVAFEKMSAGNMVYGLMRSDALERAGVLRWQLLPDRLLISELSLYGPIIGVPELLWYRRYRGLASIARQKRASFFEYRPFYLHLPWWAAHSLALYRHYGRHSTPHSPISCSEGKRLAVRYAILGGRLVFRRSRRRMWARVRNPVVANVRSRARALTSVGRAVRRSDGIRPLLRALRAGINAIPGKPHRHLRPLYVPLASIVFRRQKA